MQIEKIVKISGIAISVLGMGLSVAGGILDDKRMDIKIAREVAKHLKKK